MRKLLSPKNEYIWTPTQDKEFKKSKDIQNGATIQSEMDNGNPHRRIQAQRHWLRPCPVQSESGQNQETITLIQCASSSLTSAQGNYATIELECLTIQYAVSKLEFYLQGLPIFQVWTDLRPLVGIFNKPLHMLNNQWIIRIREKLLDFSFTVTWVQGKTHYIADALSR